MRALRQQQAVPVLNALQYWLEEQMHLVPSQSALGKTMGYLHKQWEKLTLHSTDGRLRIDNSLIETAKANGIEPYAYLKTLFTDLPNAATVDYVERLLPIGRDLAL